MQRDYIWPTGKVLKLLDSLYKRWPIGSFYVWQTSEDYPSKDKFGGYTKKLDGIYGFLLDGQQRLTSLALAVRGVADGDLEYRAFFDLENERFYRGKSTKTITKRVENGDAALVPLSDIVIIEESGAKAKTKNIQNIIDGLKEQKKLGINSKNETIYRERLDRLADLYKPDALCEVFSDKTEEDAFELFYRLNKGGTSLKAGDVEGARLASASTKKIVGPMRGVAAEKEMKTLGLNFIFLLRCLVTVHRGNCKFSDLPKSWAEDAKQVEASWRSTEKAVRSTVKLVSSEFGWATRRWLPSTMALIPVVYLLAKHPGHSLSAADRKHVRQYLLLTGLRSIFRGAPETGVNSYVNALRKSVGGFSEECRALGAKVPKNQRYPIQKFEVRNCSGMYAPLMQIYLAMLCSANAKSWPSGRSLADVVAEALPTDPLAVHHIFPKKFMLSLDFAVGQLNTMANYAIISQADNAELADRDPFEVWRSLKSNQREWASQQLCFSVAKEDLLKHGEYEGFLDFRSEQIAKKLNAFLGIA